MAESQNHPENAGETLSRYRYPAFAPIEHLFIGSTPNSKEGMIDVKPLLNDALLGNKEARHKLLTPPILIDLGDVFQQKIMEDRVKKNQEMSLRGGVFIDPFVQVKLSKSGVEVCMQFSELDPQTHEVAPKWKLFLLRNNEVVQDRELLEKLKIAEDMLIGENYDFRNAFSLSFPEGQDYAELFLNLPKR